VTAILRAKAEAAIAADERQANPALPLIHDPLHFPAVDGLDARTIHSLTTERGLELIKAHMSGTGSRHEKAMGTLLAYLAAVPPHVVLALLKEIEAGRALRDAVRARRYYEGDALARCHHPRWDHPSRCEAECTRGLYCDEHAAQHVHHAVEDLPDAEIVRALRAFDLARAECP